MLIDLFVARDIEVSLVEEDVGYLFVSRIIFVFLCSNCCVSLFINLSENAFLRKVDL